MEKNARRERNIAKFFRINEAENKIIEKNMKEAGIENFSIFARKSCLDKKIYQLDFSSLKEIMATVKQSNLEIKRIGNNLNQIAKHLNELEQNLTKELLNDYQKELETLDTKLKGMIKRITEG